MLSRLHHRRRRVVHRRYGWDRAEATGLVVGDCLHDFLARVHHKRPHPGDGFSDWAAAEDQDVEVWAAAFLDRQGRNRDRVAATEDGELPGPDRPGFRADGAVPGHGVDESVVAVSYTHLRAHET